MNTKHGVVFAARSGYNGGQPLPRCRSLADLRHREGGLILSEAMAAADISLTPWPAPPKGVTSFRLIVYQRWADPEKKPKPRLERLKGLSGAELTWLAETIMVEIKRRAESRAES